MPIRTCPDSTPCPPDQPLDNFSSEADDTIDYISSVFAQNPPPLLHNFDATACGETYVSQISQLDADLQAAAAALQCVNNQLTPPPPLIFNSPQTCCVPCPDGTPTCYQVPGGLFVGQNQATADSLAYQAACSLVKKNPVCLGSISGCTCVGTPYSSVITSNVPAVITLSAGSLPPGVSISFGTNSATLLGVPLVMGQYTFQIKAQTAAGPYMIKTFTITVLQIVTTSLPPFTIGTPYSFQLIVAGGSGNYAWKVTSGILPAGITLSLSGLLSGTPTSSGVNPLQFSVIDTTCESIDQTFFPPSIALATKSTTQIATVIGFPEYQGFVSTPPKRYHSLTWQGSSEQQLWKPASTAPAYNYVLVDLTGTDRYIGGGQGYQSPTSQFTVSVSGTGITEGHWIFLGATTGQGIPVLFVGPAIPAGPNGVYTNCSSLGLCPPNSFPPTINVTGPFTQPPVTTPAQQVAGARFDYSGSSTIDSHGNYTTLYAKNLSEMCSKADQMVATFLPVGTSNVPYIFAGWIGPTGHNKCPLPGTPYQGVGNQAIGKGDPAINDSSNFWGSKAVGNGAQISNFIVSSSTQGACVDSGGDQVTPVLTALFEPVDRFITPPVNGGNQGSLWFAAAVVWNHNYSSLLSAEYTDAEALANAQVIQGTGAVAQNQPRTTGFVSVFTNVVYTITLGNLISGVSYTVSVDLADITAGTVTTKIYNVSGSAASTTITDIIPTPAVGHLVQVRNARIAFS